MASNRCLQSETALNQNCLVQSLGNEVGRRLDSFSGSVGMEMRVAALDRFSEKLLNSGHKVETIRNILVSGIKGFKRRVARCEARNIPLHRIAQQSASTRRTKKLLAKSQWFRDSQEDEDEPLLSQHQDRVAADGRQGGNMSSSSKGVVTDKKEMSKTLRTSTVLFVEFTRSGELQKRLRESLDRMTDMLGFRVRVAEKGGTSLGSLLSNKNL